MSASKNVIITIPKSENEMITAFQALVSCVSKDESRYYINGIYIEKNNSEQEGVNIVSTDGHSLFALNIPGEYVSGLPSNWKGAIFPVPYFGSKAKSLWHGKGADLTAFSIELSKGKEQRVSIWRMGNGSSYTTNEIDGNFPDYRPVIPKEPLMAGGQFAYTIALNDYGKHEGVHIESGGNGTTVFLEKNGAITPLIFEQRAKAKKLSYASFNLLLLQRLKPLAKAHDFPLRWSINDQWSPIRFVGGRENQNLSKGPIWKWRYVVMPMRGSVKEAQFEYLTQEGWELPPYPSAASTTGKANELEAEVKKLREELRAAKTGGKASESNGEVKALRKELQVLQRAQRVEVETSKELDEENKQLKAELIEVRKQLEMGEGDSPLPLNEAHVEIEVQLWEEDDVNFDSGVFQAFFEVDEYGEILLKVALSGYGSSPLDLREFSAAAKAISRARGMEKVWVYCDPSCLVDTPEPALMEDGTIQA